MVKLYKPNHTRSAHKEARASWSERVTAERLLMLRLDYVRVDRHNGGIKGRVSA